MAVIVTQLFAPSLLSNTVGTIYTAPTSPTNIAVYGVRARFTNQDTATRSITVYAVPSGGSAATSNEVVATKSIAASDFLDLDLPVLAAGGSYQALADVASKVNMSQLSGILIS